MVSLNKKIVRTILIATYILIISLVIYGISSIYSYLNTGADRSSILHTEIKKINQYLPEINWAPINNEGRQIDSTTLNAIENNYLDAWYIRHIAYKSNLKNGIEDYYTDNARKNLYAFIDSNFKQKITIESTTLKHNPILNFFSEDGQLAVITDKDVIEYKHVFKGEELIGKFSEKSTYKIILLLEDGFWRIRHLVKESTEIYKPKYENTTLENFKIKGINYYPQDTPWTMFGENFNSAIIEKDFKLIHDSGLNTIRLFIQYEDFGSAKIAEDKILKLQQTLDIAEINGLKVIITLFDFYGDYSILNWTLNHRHAKTIVSKFKKHNALLAWDIKNEPNLDFESRGKDNVTAWLDTMINLIKSVDKEHPVTIGWSDTNSASTLKEKVDFVSFHYYKSLDTIETEIKILQTKIPNKKLVLQEFGLSSYKGIWNPFGNSKKDQANYFKKAQEIITKYDLGYLSWTLYDFTEVPKEVVGRLPWRRNIQKRYGFIDENGVKKEAFKYISKK